MSRIALLVTHGLHPSAPPRDPAGTSDHQVARLAAAFAARGAGLEPVYWQDPGTDWSRFAAALPLMAWNYPREPDLFAARLDALARAGVPVLNPPDVITANADKGYLAALHRASAPVPRTLELDARDATALLGAFDTLGADEIVVKPRVGAGAWRQARMRRGAPLPDPADLPDGPALAQAFLPAVVTDGEASLLFFGGVFSHALMKRPKAGDYRTQGHHGAVEAAWSADPAALACARAVLDIADPQGRLAYARVDLVRDGRGGWLLMELELIEPFLYLAFDGTDGRAGADAFAGAILDRLT